MSAFHPNRRHKLDAKLRAVALPEGLLARLRQVATADDAGLDSAVREVPQPPGLLKRLRAVAIAEDADLDAAIREVDIPDELVRRLRVSVLAEDDALDEALRAVPVPQHLFDALRKRNLTRPSRRRPFALHRMTQMALAGSLLVAVGLALLGGAIGYLSAWHAPKTNLPRLAQQPAAESPEAPPLEFSDELEHGLAANSQPASDAAHAWEIAGPELEVLPKSRDSAFDQAMAIFAPPNPTTQGAGPIDPLLDVTPYHWGTGVLATDFVVDALPDLKRVAPPSPHGIRPPLVPGFPLDFYNRYRINPFVAPSAHPKLQSSVIPLGIDTASYELTRRYLEDGQLPPPDKVRPEEFLAALDFQYPSPQRELGVCAMGGPSVFGGEGLTMLQIGIQGQKPGDETHPAAHMVLAVDVSASMNWGGRIDSIRRALRSLITRMGPDDRISLVAFSEDATTIFENVSRYEAEPCLRAIDQLSVRSSTNVGAGLRQAYTVAGHYANAPIAVRVVLMTDGAVEFDASTLERIENRIAASPANVHLDTIDLGQSSELNPRLENFARIGGGKAYRATSTDQTVWSLAEILTGQPQLIARDVCFKITFNPKTVLFYRLIGHEPAGLSGLAPESPQTDFHKGQSATGMYELRLTAGGDQDIATVEISWYRAENGGRETLSFPVTRKQFSATFVRSEPSLQAGILATQTAEVLRNPNLARNERTFAALMKTAKQVDPILHSRPSFTEFESLLEKAGKAKFTRPGEH